MPASVPGIHHVTAITADVQKNVDFYVTVLGLRFIKQTVNFDVPDTYHVYFGDYVGTPGSAMTFFGWPHLPWRAQGTGQVLTVAFAVPPASLGFWSDRLRRLGVDAATERRFGRDVLAFPDADGIRIALVGEASDDRWVPWQDGPVPERHAIRSFHSVELAVAEEEPSARFLIDTMGFRETGREGPRVQFETGAGGPAATAQIRVAPELHRGEEATGTVHHVAWRALDDEHQLAWREAVIAAGADVTPVIERKYFRSIYFREPGGVLFEVATDEPGFTVDEPAGALGSGLQLPAWHEHTRPDLEVSLPPIRVPAVERAAAGG